MKRKFFVIALLLLVVVSMPVSAEMLRVGLVLQSAA